MDDQVIQILLDLAQENARHIDVLNRELGEVVATLRIMTWFIGVNVVAWIGIFAGQIKNIFNKK